MPPKLFPSSSSRVAELRAAAPSQTSLRKPPHGRLTEQDVIVLKKKLQERFGWEPRPFQLEGVKAQLNGDDTIIQAATGAGKTAIPAGPFVWPNNEDKIVLMVSPLLALEEEMVSPQAAMPALYFTNLMSSLAAHCTTRYIPFVTSLNWRRLQSTVRTVYFRRFSSKCVEFSCPISH